MHNLPPGTLSATFERSCGAWRSEVCNHPIVPLERQLWANPEFQVRAGAPSSELYEIELPSVGTSRIDFARRTVSFAFATEVDARTVEHLLADQVLPRILAHFGALVVHAAAVLVNGKAILLVGRSGSGKSTLAASFVSSGHTLLGDDAIIIEERDGQLMASAVYQSLRLFPDSAEHVLGGRLPTGAVANYTTKRRVLGLGGNVGDQRFPLAAVFVVDGPQSSAVQCTPVSAADSCMALLEHSFWLDPNDQVQIRNRMAKAAASAAQVPTWTLSFRRIYSQLPGVREAVLDLSAIDCT